MHRCSCRPSGRSLVQRGYSKRLCSLLHFNIRSHVRHGFGPYSLNETGLALHILLLGCIRFKLSDKSLLLGNTHVAAGCGVDGGLSVFEGLA